MCRFVLYMGPDLPLEDLVTRPSNSIIHQSFQSHERSEPLNGDGFGVAWYTKRHPERPARFRSVTPAWNNANLLDLARVVSSEVILAHVRAATIGLPVVHTNCHPFVVGRYAFMHNGSIDGFPAARRAVLARLSDEAFAALEGTTDSEHVFALFLDRLRRSSGRSVEDLAVALEGAIEDMMTLAGSDPSPALMNLVVTDGQRAVVSRYSSRPPVAASLYLHRGTRYACGGDGCAMVESTDDEDADTVLIASEPLSEDAGWREVPINHLILIDEKRRVTLRPIT